MATRIIELPNGLYGRFSTIVDDFTHMNLTKEEMKKVLQTEYYIHPVTIENMFKYPHSTWIDTIKTIRELHGTARMHKVIKYIK